MIPTLQPTGSPTAIPDIVATAAPDVTGRIDQYVTQLVDQGRFSGAVLVATGNTVRFAKAYGFADREHSTPNTLQTSFQIGSLTKQFTAMAILLLQADGKLRVEDRICQYVTSCPNAWSGITIHQLLTDTSGLLADYDPFVSGRGPVTPDQLLQVISTKPLLFAPGERFEYSNSGYVVLGSIVERVSGQSYGDLLQQRIFTPLGMTGTNYGPSGTGAIGYVGKAPAPLDDPTRAFSAGGLWSTAEDLYRWSQALDDDTLLSASLRALMFKPHVVLPDQTDISYGYGWFILTQDGLLREEHGGFRSGYQSAITRFPERGITIIWLSNVEDQSDLRETIEPIVQWALGKP